MRVFAADRLSHLEIEMEEQTLTASDSKTSRRHFLDLLLGASVLGWLASVAYPD